MVRSRSSALPLVTLLAAASAASAALLGAASGPVVAAPGGAPPPPPTVVHQGVVTRQDIPSRAGSETDTVVEPHVAVSPRNKDVAIAVAHDSRYSDGGAVTISAAWTRDGGATWHHRPVPGITTATGGPYPRASDPVVAFGPGGRAYLSVIAVDLDTCDSAVGVLTSDTGGATWSRPHWVIRTTTCDVFHDKNWLVVDTSPASPHRGRVYQFWTLLRFAGPRFLGAPQVLRWSDDQGRTWSHMVFVTRGDHFTQNSQPMIRRNGSIVDTYSDVTASGGGEEGGGGERSPALVPEAARSAHLAVVQRAIDATGTVFAARSTNGGRTWSDPVEVANNTSGFAPGVRCCLFAGDIDPVSQRMHVAWLGGVGSTDPVFESWSDDGVRWSSPVQVSRGDRPGVQRVNVDVAARAGKVYVTYGTRTGFSPSGPGRVQQQISGSGDGGSSFGGPKSLGPVSDLRYAARAGGLFPGDYIGLAYTQGRLYGVWAVSSKPPASSTSRFHQVIYGVTLRP